MLPYFNPIFGAVSNLLNRKRDDDDDMDEYHQEKLGKFETFSSATNDQGPRSAEGALM